MIRELLDRMVTERRDYYLRKETKKKDNENKQARERELVQLGKLTRENVSLQLIGEDIVPIGGGAAVLRSDGSVGHDNGSMNASILNSPTLSEARSVKRRKTSSRAQQNILNDAIGEYQAQQIRHQEEKLKVERERNESEQFRAT